MKTGSRRLTVSSGILHEWMRTQTLYSQAIFDMKIHEARDLRRKIGLSRECCLCTGLYALVVVHATIGLDWAVAYFA